MNSNNSELFLYVSDIIRVEYAQDLIEEAGGLITSSGLVWPMDTADEIETVYYYINVVEQKIYFLPKFETDLSRAEEVSEDEEIILVINNLKAYLDTLMFLEDGDISESVIEIRFNSNDTPRLHLNQERALYMGNFSLS